MVWVLSLSHRTSGIILTAGVSLHVIMHFSTIPVYVCTPLFLSLPHSLGVSAGSIAYLVSGKSFPEFITGFQSVAHYPVLWTATKFIVALPLCYHMVNGIRHLVSSNHITSYHTTTSIPIQAWDAGKGFEMKTLYKTGYIMLATTLLLTGALTFYKPSP